jgi:hypothetical protein
MKLRRLKNTETERAREFYLRAEEYFQSKEDLVILLVAVLEKYRREREK